MIFIIFGFTFIFLRPLRQPKIVIQIVAGIIMGPSLLAQSKVYVANLMPPGARVALLTFAEFGFISLSFTPRLQNVPSPSNPKPSTGDKHISSAAKTPSENSHSTGDKRISSVAEKPIGGIKLLSHIIGDLAYHRRPCISLATSHLIGGRKPIGDLSLSHTLVHWDFIDTSLVKSIGRKAAVIALTGTIIPMVFGVAAYKIVEQIGRFASSISLVSDACVWFLAFIVRNIGAALKYSPTEPLSIIALVVGYYCFLLFLMRPLVIWIDSFTPKNRPIGENHLMAILCIVLVNGFLAEYIGEHARFGAFVLGLSLPNGPTLGAIMIQKLEVLCTGFLLPIYCATSGFKAKLSSIANMSAAKTELIIFAGYFGKSPFKESLTLTLVMCCKGAMEITTYTAWHDAQMITTQTYTLLLFSMIITRGLATIFIRHLYDPSTRYMVDTRRTVTNSAQNSGLRMLVCIHSEENVSSFTNLIEVSNPTKEKPIFVCVLQLVEITGRAASILVKLDKKNNLLASNLDYSRQISNAFDHYENYSEGVMHDDICTLAVDKKTSLIVVPFYKTWAIDGTAEANIPFFRTINKNVLKKAPCSIEVLVDRGEVGGNLSILTGNSSYLIAMLCIGGADDREALALTVVQLIALGYNMSSYQNNLDKEAMDELWASINGNQKIKLEKETVRHGADTTQVIQKMANNFDLVIVGRYHEPHSPVKLGPREWSECPELGVLGDLLASSSFRFSVLVVQHDNPE
ncbi:hypothetical protein ACB092_08G038300 [Castanea dentata]